MRYCLIGNLLRIALLVHAAGKKAEGTLELMALGAHCEESEEGRQAIKKKKK